MNRCLMIANTSWYLFNFHQGLILDLQEAGWEVETVAPEDDYTVKLQAISQRHHTLHMHRRGGNPLKDLIACRELFCLFRQRKPQAVLNFTPKPNVYGTLAAHWLDIPAINNITGLGTLFAEPTMMNRVAQFLFRISQPKAHHVLFQNQDDRTLFIDRGYVAADKTSRIPGSGIDLNRFIPTEAPNDGIVRFILVARMLRMKGVEEFVEAARQLKAERTDVEFLLLGHVDAGSANSISESQIKGWHKEGVINYLGGVSNVAPKIAQADCVVLPSYYREGVPRSLLEAAAMAKPIITTDTVGCRDAVDHGLTGLICQPRNAQSLKDALTEIANMSHIERIALGQAGRIKMQKSFDVNRVIKAYINLLAPLKESPVLDTLITDTK